LFYRAKVKYYIDILKHTRINTILLRLFFLKPDLSNRIVVSKQDLPRRLGNSKIGQYFSQIKNFGGDFGSETRGLVPLSNGIHFFRTNQQPLFPQRALPPKY